jgi:hypothetical protein
VYGAFLYNSRHQKTNLEIVTEYGRLMARRKTYGLTLCLFPTLLLQSANAATRFADYPGRTASECAAKAESGGVVIGVQPIEDSNEQRTYFGMDLTAKGFIPVYVVLESTSSAHSYILEKTAIKLGTGSAVGSVPPTSLGAGKTAAIDTGAIASSAFVPFVGAIFAMVAFNKADALRQNFIIKELQSSTISPGRSVRGFLYVPVPKKGARGKLILEFPLAQAGTSNSSTVSVEF